MTKFLELREKLRNLYGKYEIYVVTALKFMLALTAFWLINSKMGYMEQLNNPAVVLILALLGAFLPINASVIIASGLIIAHLSALSLEVCLVGVCLFVLMFFMYYRFAPKNGYRSEECLLGKECGSRWSP